jgi:hypothetical protein
MKNIITAFIVPMLMSTVLFGQQNEPEVHEEWRLRKDEDGVQVYTRWIDASGTRKARQMRIEMTTEGNPEDVIAVIRSDRDASKWVYRAKQYYIFDIEDDQTWHTYTEMGVPWPFNNRDLVLKNQLEWSTDRSLAQIKLVGVPKHMPEVNSIQRIQHFDGLWHIERIAPDRVRVRYEIFTKSEPVLPRWIIDPIVEQGFWDTLRGMRALIHDYTAAVAKRNR